MEHAIRRLGNLELSADKDVEAFYRRKDEIGMIAQTIHHVCDCLRKTIEDIGRILGEMAEGNIAVDVSKNESYYIGDFKVLSTSLKSIRTHLTDVMRNIAHIAGQVGSGANQVSEGAHCRFGGKVSDFLGYNREAFSCGAGAGGFHGGIQRKDIRLKGDILDCLDNTADLRGGLLNILCRRDQLFHFGIGECIQSIKTLMDEIALASVQQSEMIVSVENRIREVSKISGWKS